MALLHNFVRRVNFTKFQPSFVNKILCIYTLCVWVTSRRYNFRPSPPEYFWSRLYESGFRPHKISESALRSRMFLKSLSRLDVFGSDGFGEFVWTTETGYFWSQQRQKLTLGSNENLQIQNGSITFCLLASFFRYCSFNSSILSEYLDWGDFHSMFSCRRWLFLSKVRLHHRSFISRRWMNMKSLLETYS